MAQYEVTVTAETERPLSDAPLGVTVEQGKTHRLHLESAQDYAEADLAVEYVARFYGHTSMTVVSDGGFMYGL